MNKALFLLGLTTILFSCQKEIDVDLDEADTKMVIEANFTAEDSTVRVLISSTSSYFDATPPNAINNASVQIVDYLGVAQNVPLVANGYFELTNYIPVFNTTYVMNVTIGGVNYTAECTLHNPVNQEEITYELIPNFFGANGGYITHLIYQDPVDTVNFYQLIQSVNGVPRDSLYQIILQDDQFSDGNLFDRPLFSGFFFDLGDTIEHELRSIDADIYYYYNEAISIVGGGLSSAPANPDSNWDNDALGYFSAYSSNRKSVVLQ